MGKGGKGKDKAKPAVQMSDDDMLDAAIAENKAAAEAAMEKKKAQVAKDVEVARQDQQARALSKQEIVERLDELPAFTIVDANKQFVALSMKDASGNVTEEYVSMIWTEPSEAKAALAQAVAVRPDAQLALGTIPLGKAYALCEGWAEAETVTRFRLQAHAKASEELRPVLTRQLEQQGLPTQHVFPVFMCEQLTTDACMPVFLSRAEMVSTWERVMQRAGLERKPPETLTTIDLKILVARMQTAGTMNWSVLTFVGTERGMRPLTAAIAAAPPLLASLAHVCSAARDVCTAQLMRSSRKASARRRRAATKRRSRRRCSERPLARLAPAQTSRVNAHSLTHSCVLLYSRTVPLSLCLSR